MTNALEVIRKENNSQEKILSKENNSILTDMVGDCFGRADEY